MRSNPNLFTLCFAVLCATTIAAPCSAQTAVGSSSAATASPANSLPPTWTARPPVVYAPVDINAPRPFTGNASPPFSPAEVAGAYGLNALALSKPTGNGITVAIVDAYGDFNSSLVDQIQNDLKTFCTQYNLPYAGPTAAHPTLTESFPGGLPTSTNSNWAIETALDVEWVHSIAPGAQILLVVSPDNGSSLYSAVQTAASGAPIVSMSWGGGEWSGESSYDTTYFSQPGVAYFASTGDSGADGGVEYPSISPNVTAIGGTSLTISTSNAWVDETGWAGSGGGESSYEAMPAFQGAWFTPTSSYLRVVPDVSAIADPNTGVAVYRNGSWLQVGGTSLACPVWAAMTAIVDANLTTPLDEATLHADLYNYGSPATFTTYFHDIVTGNNGLAAGIGFDPVTGIGSPQGSVLLPTLANIPIADPIVSSFAPLSGPVGTTVTITGTGFGAATAVRLNGASMSFDIKSAKSITAIVPVGATTGRIDVYSPAGKSVSPKSFTVVDSLPSITSFTPTIGAVGTSVTITGTNLFGATTVSFNGTAATAFTVNSTTQVVATVPAGATTGPITVNVPSGTATSASSFTVVPAPTISALSPTYAYASGSDVPVTVTGTQFVSTSVVKYGSNVLATTFVSSTQLTATITAAQRSIVGSFPVTVVNPNNIVSNSKTFTIKPRLTGLTLLNSRVSGGERLTGIVTLNGTAPTGGLVIALSSSNQTAASVMTSVTVFAGSSTGSFAVVTTPVATKTTVTIGADGAGASKTATLTVLAPLKPSADTYAQDGNSAGTNFGTTNPLLVKASATAGTNRISYLKFSLSGFTNISQAQLFVTASLSGTGTLTTGIYPTSSSWTESALTWNNKPALQTGIGSFAVNSTSNGVYFYDVTQYVLTQLASGTVSFGLQNPTTSTINTRIVSRDGGSDAPTLVISGN